jgi:hypothetical protein
MPGALHLLEGDPESQAAGQRVIALLDPEALSSVERVTSFLTVRSMTASDERRANEILSQQVTGEDWTCACGETLGAQFTQCWRCGAYRSA